jgi:hypothetical protein
VRHFNVYSEAILMGVHSLLLRVFKDADYEDTYTSLKRTYFDRAKQFIERVQSCPLLEQDLALGFHIKLSKYRNGNTGSETQRILVLLSPTPLRIKDTLRRLCEPHYGTLAWYA